MKWIVVERAEGWRVRDNNGDFVGESQGTLSKAIALMRQLRDNQPRKKLPKKVRRCIEAALRRVDSKQRTGCGVSKEAQEAMRLYLDTWAALPLQAVLDWDDGTGDPRDVEIWGRD